MISRDQFIALAGQLFDQAIGGSATAPSAATGDGRSPRFDTTIPRKNQMVQYASECSLRELTYWYEQAGKPPTDPKYAAKNEKQRKSLSYWLAYRQAEPTAVWTGERNRETVTALAPSDKPQQYTRPPWTGGAPPDAVSAIPDDGMTSHPVDEFGDIPF